jgi:NAD(P)-dependent dehydrogenase (short-subunit alcohol dehydrogenase family)
VARELRGAVIVITGASSGIGRAAALAFAREGSRLALAARSPAPLRELASECAGFGTEAIAVTTDVSDEHAVQRLANEAIRRFGRIDVWINGAGVIAYGRFEDVPSDVFRAVIETNLLGQVNGARAALAHFRRQGDGTLINLASVWGRLTSPQVSPYVASKFAIRAFSECLRQEMADVPGIQVATILPQAVDTPIFRHAANYSGQEVRPIPPLLGPERVALGIVRCARTPAREVTFGRLGRALELLHAFAPRLHARTVARGFEAGSFGPQRRPSTAGNVLAPSDSPAHTIGGHWRDSRRQELLAAFAATAITSLRGLLPRHRAPTRARAWAHGGGRRVRAANLGTPRACRQDTTLGEST